MGKHGDVRRARDRGRRICSQWARDRTVPHRPGRFQFSNPAAALGPLFSLSRPGRIEAQGQAPARHARGCIQGHRRRLGRRQAWRSREQRARTSHHDGFRGRRDAAGGVTLEPFGTRESTVKAMGAGGGGVQTALVADSCACRRGPQELGAVCESQPHRRVRTRSPRGSSAAACAAGSASRAPPSTGVQPDRAAADNR